MTDQVVTLRIAADGKAAITGIRQVETELDKVGRSGTEGGRKAAAGLRQVEAQAGRTATAAQSATKYLTAMFTAAAAIAGIRATARMADEYTNLSSKIKLVTDSQREMVSVRSQIVQLAQDTRAQLSSTGDLYTKLARSTTSLHLSQQELLRITRTVNEAFVVSGASAADANAAIIQLGQGLASGTLRGDEFNSVAEQAPTILHLVADYLHMTTGELRAFAAQGGITAEIMVGALAAGAAKVDEQFGQMQLTIGGAWTQLINAVTVFVGASSQASGASAGLAASISLVAMHLGTLVNTVMVVGIARLGAMTASFVAARVAAQASRVATAALAEQELVAARAAETEAAAIVAKTRAMQLGGVTARNAAAAEAGYAAASLRTAAARDAVAASSLRAGARIAGFGKRLLALAGGPVGIAIAAIAGMALHFHHLAEAEDAWVATNKAAGESMTQAAEKARGLAADLHTLDTIKLPPLDKTIAEWTKNEALATANAAKLADAQQHLTQASHDLHEAQIAAANGAGHMGKTLDYLQGEYRTWHAQVESLQGPLAALQAANESVGASLTRRLTPALAAATEKMKGLSAASNMASVITSVGAAVRAFLGKGGEIVAADKQFHDLFGQMQAQATAAAKAVAAAGKSHHQLALAMQTEIIALAKLAGVSGKALDGIKAQTAAMVEQLSGLDKVKKATGGVTDSQKALTAALDAQNKLRESAADQLRDLQLKAQGVSDATLAYEHAVLDANEAMRAAIAAGGDAQKAAADYLATVGDLQGGLKLATAAQADATDTVKNAPPAYDAAAQSAQNMARIVDSSAQSMSDMFAQGLLGMLDSSESISDRIEDVFKQMIASMIAQIAKVKLFGPMLESVFGGMLGGGGGYNVTGYGGGYSSQLATSVARSFIGDVMGGGNVPAGTLATGNGAGAMQSGFSGLYSSVAAGFGKLYTAISGWFGGSAATGSTIFASGFGGASAAGAASGTAAGTAAASISWVPIIGWIVAAVLENISLYQKGYQAGLPINDNLYEPGHLAGMAAYDPAGFTALTTDKLLQSLGMNSFLASLFSGSSLAVNLWGHDKPHAQYGGFDADFGQGGVSGSQYVHWRADGGVFSDADYGTETTALGKDILAQLEKLWKAIESSLTRAGVQLGLTATESLAGFTASLKTKTTPGKDGEDDVTEYIVSMLGRSWTEASQDDALARIGAEGIISVIDAWLGASTAAVTDEATKLGAGAGIAMIDGMTAGVRRRDAGMGPGGPGPGGPVTPTGPAPGEASAIAARWRDDAQQLAQGAQFLFEAVLDMRHGIGLLGEGAGVLTKTADLVGDLQMGDETLSQTYERLVSETDSYKQALALAGVESGKSAEAIVRFADGLAQAVGGADQASALWNSFFSNYYSQSELAAKQVDQLKQQSDFALAAIGDGASTTMAQLRSQIEAMEADPLVTPDQLALYLEAADALAQYNNVLQQQQAALAQAKNQYAVFMEQIRVANGAAYDQSFARALAGLETQMRSTIAQANALAKAAGMAGASESDLAAIHERFAQQAAAMIAQLQSQSQSLVQQLYGGVGGLSLDQLNAQIAALQSSSTHAATGIQQAAAKIDQTASLLIGDLSPYSDRQKLEIAKQQLLSGQASAQDVLQIGRRLMASGADYTQLFQWVTSHAKQATQPPHYASSAGSISDSARLEELIKQRDKLEAAQRLGMAQQLASNVVQLATVHGETFAEVAKDLGFSLTYLAKDLGVQDIQSYLSKLQAQDLPGALDSTATTIVDAIRELGADLIAALTGTPIDAGYVDRDAPGAPHPGAPNPDHGSGIPDATITVGPTYTLPDNYTPPAPSHPAPGPWAYSTMPPRSGTRSEPPYATTADIQKLKEALDEIGKILGLHLPAIEEHTERGAVAGGATAKNTTALVDQAVAAPAGMRSARVPMVV